MLSGGQSLMPAMNLRLISPGLIVDIGELAELRGIAVTGEFVRLGALTRHVDLARSTILRRMRRCSRKRLRMSRIRRSATVARSAAVSPTPIPLRNCRPAWSR